MVAVTAIFILLFAISNSVVNSLLGYDYSNVTPFWASSEGISSKWMHGEIFSLVRFAADRWIGA